MLKRFLGTLTKQNETKISTSGKSQSKVTTNPIINQQNQLQQLANSIENTKDKHTKSVNISKLRNIIKAASLNDLINNMKSDNELIRSLSAQTFAELDSPNLYDCMEAMLSDNLENLRIACTESLSYLSSPKYINLLQKAMADKSPKVRIKAAMGLVDIASAYGNKEALKTLNASIEDEDEEVREFIEDELSLLGYNKTYSTLLEAF